MIRIDNVKLYTGKRVYLDGCVLVDGDRIAYAGENCGCPLCFDAEHINGRGGILMPGFYNTHCHAPMTLFRGVGSDLPLHSWLERVGRYEAKLDGMAVYWGAMLGIQEMIRRGVVAFADMYFFMDYVAQAVIETGIRANLCRGCSDVAGIDSVDSLCEQYHMADAGRIQIDMGIHAEYTSTPDVVRYALERAQTMNLGIQVHNSETANEVAGCLSRHGVTPTRYFYDLGLLNRRTILAHCVHLTEEDRALIAESGAFVAHCPASNMKLASGIAPIGQYVRDGLHVALGTDGAASNNALDMQADMRLASILQKGVFGDPTLLSAQEALHMATREGALAMGLEDCGYVETGMKADMVLMGMWEENLMPVHDVPTALVYGAQGLNVRMTMVDGRVLYKDGQFLTLNSERVITKAMDTARRLGVVA